MFAKNWPSLISRFIFASFSFLMIYFLFFSQAPIPIVNARAHVRSFVRSRESTYPPPPIWGRRSAASSQWRHLSCHLKKLANYLPFFLNLYKYILRGFIKSSKLIYFLFIKSNIKIYFTFFKIKRRNFFLLRFMPRGSHFF